MLPEKIKEGSMHPWDVDVDDADKFFLDICKDIPYGVKTTLDNYRLWVLYQHVKQTSVIPGIMVEVGAFKGGSAKLISKTCPAKSLFVCDTFEGMPDTCDPNKDYHHSGDFRDTSFYEVKAYLDDCPNVRLIQGKFPEAFSNINVGNKYSFAHIDVDIYQSVKDCCEYFYNKMAIGGVMIFDDYGFYSCPGAKKAVDEFFYNKLESPILLRSGQAIVTKLWDRVAT